MTHVDHQALKAGAALLLIDLAESVEQLFEIIPIACAGARIARRVYTGCSAQGIDFQSRVVGDGGQSGVLCSIARLQYGVLDKGETRLFYLGNRKRRLRHHFQLGITQ